MENIYSAMVVAKKQNKKLLAILLDPDKIDWDMLQQTIEKINSSDATHIFIGGSLVTTTRIGELILQIKRFCKLPVLLFPGNPSQISDKADGILFLSLISGRNPDFLIGHHTIAAPVLAKTALEIIPTGYILIESGSETAVETISKTVPLSISDIDKIVYTAQAGAMLGNKLIYLEAGSGAKNAVPSEIIRKVSENISVPLIVGGGIRNRQGISDAFDHGADLVVIGTAFENNPDFFETA
ncbi:geranylgeranylglyceryl/heptaprenylglyceryl phosphate synthase [Flavobacterium sp.]|uniref:geranylgeranylglyceryl/heptaprenylglyceryl phosphate synthase n=1 Tax=Flavobacterium sp. TaxID=239 RepID=UPI002619CF97|nr:geranylgeranylglyceryl/heptaprenylglyceryl phosphate synthase [Flavobacterium sp.]